ncbi:nucleotidyltransferase domain-containing protein [candidate division KSB1 bacterium]|nr:nucleotidyltransferase domain-containing protein [candidate division KSB1 bacterium]
MTQIQKNRIKDQALQKFLDALLNIIIDKFKPTELWLWGSRVYGVPRKYSDIDLIIISDAFKNMRMIKRRPYFLRSIEFDKYPDLEDVDAFCYTQEEFEKKKNDPWMFKDLFSRGIRII